MRAVIIDDEVWIREGLKVQIPWEELGIAFAGEASNGVDGLRLIETVEPEIVITDIAMPLMNGLELLETIRSRFPDLVVVIISGYAEFEYARKALMYDASDYILKPFDEETLVESMRKAKRRVLALRAEDVTAEPGAGYKLLTEMLHRGGGEEELTSALRQTGLEALPPLPARVTVAELTEEQPELAASLKQELERKTREQWSPAILFQDYYDPQRLIMLTSAFPPSAAELWFSGYDKVKVGTGEKIDSYADLKKSYDAACLAMKYSGWLPGRKVIAHEAIKDRKKSLVLLDEIVSDFIKRLETGERDRLLPWFFGWFEQQLATPEITLESLQKTVLELMLAVGKWSRKNDNGLCSLFDGDETLTIALQSDTLADFKLHFTAFVEEAVRMIHSHKTGGTKRTIEEVKAYIDEHYTDEISLNWVAEHFYINPAYLSRSFKQEAGQNFNEYIMQLRMNKAVRLLEDENLKLELVSQMCGFENPKYFFKRFKQFYGCTPSEYRKTRLTSSPEIHR